MKLIRAHIKNFQSVHDSTSFEVHDVTCLVGKNESGKTAILQALYRLNPINANEGSYNVTDDYPRTNVTEYQQQVAAGKRKPDIVVEATFQLEPSEATRLEGDLGAGVLLDRAVTLVKGYENALQHRLTCSEPIAGQAILRKANLQDQFQSESWKTLAELNKILAKRAEEAQQKAKEQTALAEAKQDPTEKADLHAEAKRLGETQAAKTVREKLDAILKVGLSSHIYSTYIEPNLPKFLYFDEYYQMRGCENIEALQQRLTANTLRPSDHPLLGLIDLASLKLPELVNLSRTRELINQLEGAGNHLSKQILKYWSQNKHLQLKFDVRPAKPGDPAEMTQGNNIWASVYDSKHMVTTDLGVRSRGFVWFFSFLAWYSRQRSFNQKLIILLDEPGLYLHAKAQEDLLKYFEVELKPNHQLIFSTHSPFMVDSNHFDRVRIVQDKSIDSDVALPPEQEGTKVIIDVLEATSDSLFPLQGALGYEIYQTLFIGPNSLVVEGVSDLLYGVLGATNLTLAGLKTAALGETDAMLAVLAPETGGGTLAVAAVATTYGVTSISGQTLSGMGQLYSAFSGNAEGGEKISQVGDILSGPAFGLSTLMVTGNASLAQRNANIENTYAAGPGFVGATSFRERVASGVDAALGIFGLSGAGCHP